MPAEPAVLPGPAVKICGITRVEDIQAAAAARVGYLGFVFFEKSPRHLTLERAAALAAEVPAGMCKVALTVDMDDASLEALLDAVPLDLLQLHGRETPARVAALRARAGLPVMKAVGIADESDLAAVDAYAPVADMLLLDTKAPKGAALPGGNGLAFDWRLLAGRRIPVPWMLAGGLTPETVGEAVARTGAKAVDVSSGVEAAPGRKDPARIAAFIAAARAPAPILT